MWNDASLLPQAAMTQLEIPLQTQVIAPLGEYQLVVIEGPDAEKFLQGQCTCDFRRLAAGEWLRGAHCNAKGRMHCSFIAAQLGENRIGLRIHASVVEQAMAAMKKYIMFSKAEATVAEALLLGVVAPQSPAVESAPEVGKVLATNDSVLLRINEQALEVWITAPSGKSLLDSLEGTWATAQCWHEYMLRQGIAEVTKASYEQLLPQELNYQLIDGVSFDKGCYTGQEIVARMHYRGKLKKHLYLAETELPSDAAWEFGSDLIHQNKPVGKVVDGITRGDGKAVLLALANDEALEQTVTIRHPSQPILRWQPLPYAIPNEKV